MSDIAIRVENIGKFYRLGQAASYKALRDTLTDALLLPVRATRSLVSNRNQKLNVNEQQVEQAIWALREVCFDIHHGEAVGIIGRNGAGKSTLLKILSRITEPTEGWAAIHGRVGCLLEVGTGFHPELTGRENIYLNGSILGMRRTEIEQKFDEIVDFAEVEKFIDTPVKRYSSGMYVRLAFSVAAHLEPEILVVDEVLAVGDAQFQKKCLGRLDKMAQQGRTVLFVSHNMSAIQSMCSRAIWLHGGRVVEDGPAATVISNYLQTSFSALAEQHWENPATAPGSDKVRLKSARVGPANGVSGESITVRTPLIMEFEYWNLQPDLRLNLSLHLFNEQGVMIFSTYPGQEPKWHGHPFPPGLFRSTCQIPGDLLNDGMHRVQLLVVQDEGVILSLHDDILVFDVRDSVELRSEWHGKWVGALRPNLTWSTDLLQPIAPSQY